MRPLIVTAHMASAFASSDPWSPMLDAILAYEVLRIRMGEEFYLCDPQRDGIVDFDLPLDRGTDGTDWWWACSVPEYAGSEHVRWCHGRFDDRYEPYLDMGRAAKVQTAGGRYKDMRVPLIAKLTPTITWYVRGCDTCIRELLRGVTHVGQKRGAGYGLVHHWTVEPTDDDRSWYRWVPAPAGMTRGIRPPYWHRETQRPCVLPEAPL